MTHYTGTAVWFGSRRDAYGEADSPEEFIAKLEDEGWKAVEDVEVRERNLGWTVVYGQLVYGAGPDLATAKANFRKQGGKLGRGYVIAEFDEETDYLGFGGMGYSYIGNAPKVTEVDAR